MPPILSPSEDFKSIILQARRLKPQLHKRNLPSLWQASLARVLFVRAGL
ncbi:hypothetical protein MC7420_2327 [Coleofasciculus chthonoplastes PCC 7420]|uniref:Uncharacterized protein n=1 Tax=Coleofasciculus chthonoplastes PCC 7420 TaxID=118168 RepID=B4W240_9CYAN|nr:hypothetical protein MC7420_2327 [Coleofasciculus chthonoplastes PCC 7420]